MKIQSTYICPLELTYVMTRGEWKPLILWQLGEAVRSLAQLEKDIIGINQEMLLEHLKELMDFGMVIKRTFAGYPLKVEYSLTRRGQKMLEAITIMQDVGIDLMKEKGMEELLRDNGIIE